MLLDEDTTLSVIGAGVLGNDSDVDGDALSAVLVDGPANGMLTWNGDGSFRYTPLANFNGVDSFTYRANDGDWIRSWSRCVLTVNAVNDGPSVVVPGEQTTDADLSVVITGISVADADANEGTGVVRVSLTVSAGTIVVAEGVAGGLAADQIVANGTGVVVLEGPIDALNATLAAGLTYAGGAGFSESDMLTVVVDDLGNTGAGGSLVATASVPIKSPLEQDEIARAIELVEQLYADGKLTKGQSNQLLTKLENVDKQLSKGNTKVALKQLDSFTAKVLDFITSGVLTAEDGRVAPR